MSYKTDELIFGDNGQEFYRRVAPKSWWGLLENLLSEKYPKCTVENRGCGGAFTYQIRNHLETLVSDEDDVIFVLMGLNDRKREHGMAELKENTEYVIDKLMSKGKVVILLTPNPSIYVNEHYENRIYHTDEVVKILCNVANDKKVMLIDNYKYILDYVKENHMTIDDIMYGEGCRNDGLHPSDKVQELIYKNVINTLKIEEE